MQLSPLVNELQRQWQDNTRVRLGSWLILFILLSFSMLELVDYRAAMLQSHNRLQNKLEKVKRVAEQRDWLQRAEQVRSVLIQQQATLWKDSSRGLAQATIQNWLDLHMKKLGIKKYRLQVAKPQDVGPELWQVSATLKGDFSIDKLHKLLVMIEQHPKLTVIENLEIKQRRQLQHTLQLSAWFQGVRP